MIRFAGRTHPGLVRENNEDNWMGDATSGLFIVSDGLGGHFAGELASQAVVRILPEMILARGPQLACLEAPRAARQLKEVVFECSNWLRKQGKNQPGLDGFGATVALALIREGRCLIAHLGDSRVFLWRAGQLQPLTTDHSMLQLLLDNGEITLEEARSHPARNIVTRCVGMEGNPIPDVKYLSMVESDRLVLCTDGLTDSISNSQLSATFQLTLSPLQTCDHLIAAGLEAGGKDNLTAVVVDYDDID